MTTNLVLHLEGREANKVRELAPGYLFVLVDIQSVHAHAQRALSNPRLASQLTQINAPHGNGEQVALGRVDVKQLAKGHGEAVQCDADGGSRS